MKHASSTLSGLRALIVILGGLAITLSGVSFLAIGVLHARSELVTAHVARFDEERSENSTLYRAVYSYEVGGGRYELRSIAAHFERKPPVGTTITVRYSRDRPDLAAENRFWVIYFVPIFTGLIAAAMFVLRWLIDHLLEKGPNQSPEPTVMSVTPPAAQEPRQP